MQQTQRSLGMLLLLLAMMILAAWSNFAWVKKGSVLDQPIQDPDNKFVQMMRKVENAKIELSNNVYFYFRTKKVTKEALLSLMQFSEKAEKFFDEHNVEVGIASLSTLTNYHRADDKIAPFVTREDLERQDFDVEKWYEQVANRRTVKNKLMGRIKDEHDYFMVTVLPPQGFPEADMFQLVHSFLKGEYIPYWKFYFEPETQVNESFFQVKINGKVEKVDMTLDHISWIEARGEIDYQSNRETFGLMIPAIVFISFWVLALKLGSWKQATVGVTIVTIGMLFTRATIGIIDHFTPWFCPDESFTILIYTVALVVGTSFALRRLEEFNNAKFENLDQEEQFWQKWGKANQVGVASRLIVFISIMDFLLFMVYTNRLGSRSMFQMGVFASFGIFYEWILTQYFLPHLYQLFGGIGDETSKMPRFLQGGSQLVNKWTNVFAQFVLRYALQKNSAKVAVIILVSLVLVTVTFVSRGYLNMESDPGEFLNGMRIGEVRDEVNREGGPGFTFHEVYGELDLNDPDSLQWILDYYNAVALESRTVSGVLDYFLEIVERDYQEYLVPEKSTKDVIWEVARDNLKDAEVVIDDRVLKTEARQIISEIWQSIRDETDPKILKHLLSAQGVILLASSDKSNSVDVRSFVDMLLHKGDDLPLLQVSTPGKMAVYTDLDKGIKQSAIWNPIFSQIMIAIICGIWVWWNNRKRKGEYKLCPVRTGLLMAVPFVLATTTMYLFMMVFKLPFDIASSAIGNMAVSVAVDLPVFFLVAFQSMVLAGNGFDKSFQSKAMTQEVEKTIADVTANVLAFAPLPLSVFPIIYRIGALMILVLFACMVGVLFIMAPMMKWVVVKR